ncbi:MAG: hypothetical protein ACKOJD_08400 [Candidatus Limnocylindrus sp.]
MAGESLAASFMDSAIRERSDFASAFGIKVTEGKAPHLDETIHLNARDRALMSGTGFLGARVLTPQERESSGKWVTISVFVETYVPGSDIFLVATSLPRIFGETTVDRDGSASLTASIPIEAIGPGAHRFRVIGERVLDGVSVGPDGMIQVSEETALEIKKFDSGTTAIARLSGVGENGGAKEVVRFILLREPTPWLWMLLPLVSLLLLSLLRRTRRLLRLRMVGGTLLLFVAGLIPAAVGWVGLFFDLGTVGLISALLFPLMLRFVRVRKVEDSIVTREATLAA